MLKHLASLFIFSTALQAQTTEIQYDPQRVGTWGAYVRDWQKAFADSPRYQFNFVRLTWSPRPEIDGYNASKSFWQVDYPNTDGCLIKSLKDVSKVNVNPLPVILSPDSPELFKFPFAYITEAGWVGFSGAEAKNLGAWLKRGGFLMVDDFHGPLDEAHDPSKPNEWRNWMRELRKAIPEVIETRYTWTPDVAAKMRGSYVVARIDARHPIFNSFFTFNEIPHVKGTRPGDNEWEEGSSQHYIMGLFNPKGVMIALMNYNMDVGDGIEFCEDMFKTGYGKSQVPQGLKLGINYVVYSLTR